MTSIPKIEENNYTLAVQTSFQYHRLSFFCRDIYLKNDPNIDICSYLLFIFFRNGFLKPTGVVEIKNE
jgi:hypothetical protein